jgi:uncharacterized lipoprotein YmbA
MRPKLPALVLVAVLVASCATTPAPRYYTLQALAPQAEMRATASPLYLAPVAIPDPVDRAEFVLSGASSELLVDEQHRWAGSLRSLISATLAEDLARSLGDARVTTEEYSGRGYRVEVEIRELTSRPSQEARIEAAWVVRRDDGAERSARASLREPVGAGFAALADAHSRALARLSREIAAAVGDLDGR